MNENEIVEHGNNDDGGEQSSNAAARAQEIALQGLAGNLGGVFSAIVQADIMANNAQAENMINAINAGNVDIRTENSIIGMEDPLVTAVSVPGGAFISGTYLAPDEVDFDTSFSISTHDSNELSVGSEIGTSVGVQAGWGPVSASVQVDASVSVKSDKKRSTDSSATVDMSAKFRRQQAPEIFNKIIDQQLLITDRINKMNMAIIDTKLKKEGQGIVEDLVENPEKMDPNQVIEPEGE